MLCLGIIARTGRSLMEVMGKGRAGKSSRGNIHERSCLLPPTKPPAMKLSLVSCSSSKKSPYLVIKHRARWRGASRR